MKRGGKKLSTRIRMSFVAALHAHVKNKHILSFCAQNTIYRTFGRISIAFEELLHWGFRSQLPNEDIFEMVCLLL